MYCCGWEKRTDHVTNTTPAILCTKMYYRGREKSTDRVTNTTPAIRYTKMYDCGWEKRTDRVTKTTPAITFPKMYTVVEKRELTVLQTLHLEYFTFKCTKMYDCG